MQHHIKLRMKMCMSTVDVVKCFQGGITQLMGTISSGLHRLLNISSFYNESLLSILGRSI